ncbi:MAG: type I-B CRISPR-associated protein Cas5b [Halobacteriales archaeon]|nr:type I-B CRISPR-associated protein Cas5b [Halobacteriales archaeon]
MPPIPRSHQTGDQPTQSSAVSAPSINPDGVPDRCLSFTIRSDWGHFRRIDRTVTKQTYRLPPRTTIAGILAAIVGVPRDRYYPIFAPNCSSIAITPVNTLRTITEPMLGIGTNPEAGFRTTGEPRGKTPRISYPDTTTHRQIHSYELLVTPAYRLDVAIEDPAFYTALKRHLEQGTTHYTPSLGLSEFIAWIDYRGEFTVTTEQSDDPIEIESAVPNGVTQTVPIPGVVYEVERVPGFMQPTSENRKTTGYIDYTYTTTPSAPVTVDSNTITPAVVTDTTVVFA